MSISRNGTTSNPPLSVHTTHESSFTSTKFISNVISTSTGTTDIEQSVSTLTVLGSSTGYAVGGSVGGLMVVIVVAVGMVVTALLVVKRGRKGSMKVEANGSGVQAFNNALYDKGEETHERHTWNGYQKFSM